MSSSLPQSITYKALGYSSGSKPITLVEKKLEFSKDFKDGSFNVKPSEILIKIKAVALNPIDFILYKVSGPFINFFTGSQHDFGRDFSGVVEAIGSEASAKYKFKSQDRVCGSITGVFTVGSAGEYLLYDTKKETEISKIPEVLSFEEAAAYPLVTGTAIGLLDHIKAKKGDKLLVIGGLTSVGRVAIQIAKNVLGIDDITAVCSGNSSPHVTALGASQIIDYTKYDLILKPTQEAAKEKKFTAILDCVGNSTFFNDISSVLVKNGHFVTIVGKDVMNYRAVSLSSALNLMWYVTKMKLKGRLGLLGCQFEFYQLGKDFIETSTTYLGLEKVKIKIDSVYPFEDYNSAFERLLDHGAQGKVVITIP